jgi:hypothetical protein
MHSHLSRRTFLASATAAALTAPALCAAEADDPVRPWRTGVTLRPVARGGQRHTIHTYYLLSPESPDGRRVLFFSSKHPAGDVGQIRVLDRATGAETVLADDVHTEDAHRAALQQWTLGGQAVAYHEVVGQRWQVVLLDLAAGSKQIIARDRQLGFGRGDGHVLPLYGCHWNPGEHRSLELYDLKTGALRIACRIEDVEAKYGDWLAREFQGRRTSIAFPAISPDHRRAFFKIAAGQGGDSFVGPVSHRQGLIFVDLASGQLIALRPKWGHPAWHPDSTRAIEMGNLLIDSQSGALTRIPNVPALRGQHLAVAPQGDLWVSDGLTETVGGPPGEWAVLVADLRGERFEIIHRFPGNRGARSWRVNHPHPVFSADGRRLYYNVNAGEHTQLFVAERCPA